MDFSNLPDDVFLQILAYLPFDQCMRISSVSKCFNRISAICISKLKTLDLDNGIFKNLRPDGFYALLNLCSQSLEGIKFPKSFDRSLIDEFAQFTCPKLTELRLDYTRIEAETFGALIRNNMNLRTLVWNPTGTTPVFPHDIIAQKLETVKMGVCNDISFRSLAGHCPNLKHFETKSVTNVTGEGLDEFFNGCLQIETLIFHHIEKNIFKFEALHNFWQLHALRNLVIEYETEFSRMNDNVLRKISEYFPLLESLHLAYVDINSTGIRRLADLKWLIRLTLDHNPVENEIDVGVRRIAECGRLQYAQFRGEITANTLKCLVQCCQNLNFLFVRKITGVETSAAATELLQSFVGSCKRDLVIRVFWNAQIWTSNEVATVLKMLEEVDGHKIIFERGGSVPYGNGNDELM